MDEAGVFRKDIIRQFFELGLMGIEIPEEYGGSGGSFFPCILAGAGLSAGGPWAGGVRAVATRAVDAGDHFLLTGRKLWITNAAEAGLFLLFANADPDAGYRGITAFLIEREFPGFQVGKKEDKLGIRPSSTCELVLDNCRVPKENVIGAVGKGYKIAIETLN